MGYLCANFSLPRPLCSRLRPDVCDRRQMSDRRTDVRLHNRFMPRLLGAGIIVCHRLIFQISLRCCSLLREGDQLSSPSRRSMTNGLWRLEVAFRPKLWRTHHSIAPWGPDNLEMVLPSYECHRESLYVMVCEIWSFISKSDVTRRETTMCLSRDLMSFDL